MGLTTTSFFFDAAGFGYCYVCKRKKKQLCSIHLKMRKKEFGIIIFLSKIKLYR